MDLTQSMRPVAKSAALVLAGIVLAACTPGAVTRTPDASEISVHEAGRYLRQADVVADARLEAYRFEEGADGMDRTMSWAVTRCHKGPCSVGQAFNTRNSAPFPASARFCNSRRGCIERGALEDYVGEQFFVAFARTPYVQQSIGKRRVPQEGFFSVSYGFYLVHNGFLYKNDHHRLVGFSHSEAIDVVDN